MDLKKKVIFQSESPSFIGVGYCKYTYEKEKRFWLDSVTVVVVVFVV